MDVCDFRKDIFEEVKVTAVTEGEGSSAAFVSIVANYLINAEVLSDFNPSFYTGIGKNKRKLRVDGYLFDDFDFTFTLIIGDYTGDENRETVTRTYAESLFDKLIYFLEEVYGSKLYKEIEVSTPAADLVDLLIFNKERIRKYRLLIFTDGFMSDRISSISTQTFNNMPVDYQLWDINRLFGICVSDTGKQDIEIDFSSYCEVGIPCLEASKSDGSEYKSYLCIIPGNTLADIYDKYGSQLLEGNVRSFLSTKVAVNKKIRETILRIPDKFFAYNNGISATAMNLKVETKGDGKFVTYAGDFQIINGGQTTASLSNARYKDKADLSKIYVQMKLTEIDGRSDESSELVRNISRSSNSQNKVSDVDFFSTHPFHVRIEQISRRLYAPATGGAQYHTRWFYERARGQYIQAQMHKTKAEKDKFVLQNPKKQVITKTDLAKVRNSWSGYPHIVSRGAQTSFIKFAEIIDDAWNNSDDIFNEKYFRDSVALIILFKHTEQLVTKQEWYEQGYRANIVTYSIALLKQLIDKQFNNLLLDLGQIWNRQDVPNVVTEVLVQLTQYVFDMITDEKREIMNVTQWCKKENCWTQFKNCDILLGRDFNRVLIDKDTEKGNEKEAKKTQLVDSGINAQMEVVNAGAEYWKLVNDFTLKKKMQTSEEAKALRYAMRIPLAVPDEKQSKRLLELVNRARTEGFNK